MSTGKEKASSSILRLMKRMQNTSNRYVYVVGALIFAGLVFIYFVGMGGSKVGPLKDRSTTYHVQTFAADLNDEALSKLPRESFSYLAMIDAGSSGCRAHVYRYGKLGTQDGPLYIVPQHESKKVKPGLSSFAKNPTDAGKSLQGLIDFIKEQVPEKQWVDTPIWLKATAGLRLLDKSESTAVLTSVRAFLEDKANSPFFFRSSWARIISGNEEGGFGWIAYNYLMKVIGPKKEADKLPYAVVEMGGASSQVSQLAPSAKDAAAIPEEYRFAFTIEGEAYNLYTHSYLGFGAEQARESLNKAMVASAKSKEVDDPCINAGYSREAETPRKEVYEGPVEPLKVVGSSSGKVCTAAVANLFQAPKDKCAISGPFSFGCTYQPLFLTDSPNFMVFENFYYVSSALAVPAADVDGPLEKTAFPLLTTAKKLAESASTLCSKDWSTAQSSYPKDSQPKDVALKLCFSSSYAAAFLTKGIGLKEDKVVTIQKEVGGSEIEWALGAAYKEAADFLIRTNLRSQE